MCFSTIYVIFMCVCVCIHWTSHIYVVVVQSPSHIQLFATPCVYTRIYIMSLAICVCVCVCVCMSFIYFFTELLTSHI